jgi:hypothetical protein
VSWPPGPPVQRGQRPPQDLGQGQAGPGHTRGRCPARRPVGQRLWARPPLRGHQPCSTKTTDLSTSTMRSTTSTAARRTPAAVRAFRPGGGMRTSTTSAPDLVPGQLPAPVWRRTARPPGIDWKANAGQLLAPLAPTGVYVASAMQVRECLVKPALGVDPQGERLLPLMPRRVAPASDPAAVPRVSRHLRHLSSPGPVPTDGRYRGRSAGVVRGV